MSTSTVYMKWMKRLRDTNNAWSENEIIYFRKAIGRSGIQDQETRILLRMNFNDLLPNKGFKITAEQSQKGTDYLLSKSLKKDGSQRKGCKLGKREIAILLHPKVEHRLVGLYQQSDTYLPIYRAIGGTRSFEYVGTTYDQIIIVG